MTWWAIAVASAGCYLTKLAGLSVPERALSDARVRRVAALLPVAVFGALIALQTFTDGREVVLDARAFGMAAAAIAAWRRAPFLVVVLSATVATAMLRLVA